MSSITFRDRTDEALVGGHERAMCGYLVQKLFDGMVDLPGLLRGGDAGKVMRALDLVSHDQKFAYLALRAFEETTTLAGKPWNMLALQGNTAQVCGSDAMRLLARIHCQCEIWGWVEGLDRAWLAGLIEEALACGLMRELDPVRDVSERSKERGWRKVVELLRARDDDMVVMSYSVCEGFPNQYVVDDALDTELTDVGWDALTHDERWRLCTNVQRTHRQMLRMQPGNWSSYRFGDGEDAFTLLKAIEDFR